MPILKLSPSVLLVVFACATLVPAGDTGRVRPVYVEGDAKSLDAVIEFNRKHRFCIAFVDVEGGRRFGASDGSEGTACTIGKGSRIVSQGRFDYRWDFRVGDRIHLYPATDAKRVVLMHHKTGNWIPTGAGIEKRVLELARPHYRTGSHESPSTPRIYDDDPKHSWNQLFDVLFSRTVETRITSDLTGVGGFELASHGVLDSFEVTRKTYTRHEDVDRPIDALHPRHIWRPWEIDRQLSHGRLFMALAGALEEGLPSNLDRALMQVDLWSAYDVLYHDQAAQSSGQRQSAAHLRKDLAKLTRRVALTVEEIAALPDNYELAREELGLPDLFGEESPWLELDKGDGTHRLHEQSAHQRRVARIFARFEGDEEVDLANLETAVERLAEVVLLERPLLLDRDGNAVPSPLTVEVQIRKLHRDQQGKFRDTELVVHELSRRALLTGSKPGGFVSLDARSPAYLPAAGNDYTFANDVDVSFWTSNGEQPPRKPVLGSLRQRCVTCHAKNVEILFTFQSHGHGATLRAVDARLDEHGAVVAKRKMEQDDYRELKATWATD